MVLLEHVQLMLLVNDIHITCYWVQDEYIINTENNNRLLTDYDYNHL